MKSLLRVLFLGIALTGFSSGANAQNVVVPNGLTNVEGNTDNGFPFNITNFALTSQRYQQVYGSGDFSTLGGPRLITAITFRADGNVGFGFSSVLPSMQIHLSTTSAAVDGLSGVFASNVGADDAVVFNGPLPLASSASGGPPHTFDIVIALQTPFLYNPANGNLLLDVRNFLGGATTQFDADTTIGDATSRAYTNSNLSGVNSPTADAEDSFGLVTQFTFVSVPEPSTVILLGLTGVGCAAAVFQRIRRRKAEMDTDVLAVEDN
jgi:hypothetical protein